VIDVASLRTAFPALADGRARFDGPGGSLVPRPVAAAVAEAMTAGLCQRGATEVGERAERVVRDARSAVADLTGGLPGGVVFGRSMTQLAWDLARTLARDPDRGWKPGDEVLVTRLDHDAHVRPWVLEAERAGAEVRWADVDTATGDLPVSGVADLVGARTRVVAVTAASNLVGTRPDVAAIAAAAHAHGALVSVDAVHLAPHEPLDLAELGADFLLCSPYKFCGPHLGALVADPALLERLRPDKLLPSPDRVPERFELGTLPYELLAGTTAAVDFLASLDATVPLDLPRRDRVVRSMRAVAAHESRQLARLLDGLAALPHVSTYAAPAGRTPTVLLRVEGLAPAEVAARLDRRGIDAPAGTFYAIEAARALGIDPHGGVRVGLAPYTDDRDVDRLLDALADVRDAGGAAS
jgi:cysteine desulfurase family protein (TIGR01976 family)